MPRIATGLPALALALLLIPAAEAAAAGRGRGHVNIMHAVKARPFALVTRPFRARLEAFGPRRPGFHHGFKRRFAGRALSPYGFNPFAFGNQTTIVRERESEPERPIDPDSFENLPARAGIPAQPTPTPVIYRIEGTKARPVVRVLRVGIEDRRAGLRHLASAEGGNAEILTLRPR
ncbi:hypothetical protein [Bosea sp. BK604]|uniref:hypothetical protein n=1 Tax=Bosea sp. BK604 TaxID=2512180 RepID=UPI001048A4DC|nr:hypothetical protein [Bosea sp. BK604]TCR63744.1 hypothetical protein EV560_108393 [Bosea sp. BK604]